MTKLKQTIIYVVCLFPLILNAQNSTHKCSSAEKLKIFLAENPHLHSELRDLEQTFSNLQTRESILTIPVVVHVIYKTDYENISTEQVHSQIKALNRDFNKLNSDVDNTPSVFSDVVANCAIRFQLASRDPDGNATTGIVRYKTTKSYWHVNDDMKMPVKGGVAPWDPTHYLNIYVCNLGGKSLGFSSFPGMPITRDGIVIDFSAFGTEGTVKKPYHLGRTCVHEMGHWMGLFHIWGDVDCGNDYVDDTPTQKMENTGCPSFPQYSECKGIKILNMSMNFMDYVNDECMTMFTYGQKVRMRTMLQKKRGTLLNNEPLLPAINRKCEVNMIQVKGINMESADLMWETVAGVANYSVEYKPVMDNIWESIESKTPYVTLENLKAGVTYEARVKTDCFMAIPSKKSVFTTKRIALRGQLEENDISVFPNPMKSEATLSIHSTVDTKFYVNIADEKGQVRFEKIYDKNTPSVQLDFSDMTAGFYIISVIKNGKRAVSKVVKVRE